MYFDRKKLFSVVVLMALLMGAPLLADSPLAKLRQFSAVGAATSTTLTGPMNANPSTPNCSLIQTGSITGNGLSEDAQYTLVLVAWPQPACKSAVQNFPVRAGQLTITQSNGTLVMDVAVGDFNRDSAVLSGTYSVPSYNITDPTATAPTTSTGKFQNAFGSGAVVFATGSSTSAPSGSNPTQSTITLNGLLER